MTQLKITLYSANYGRYEQPKSVETVHGRVPCVLYTDDPHLVAPGWEVRYAPLEELPTPMLRAKWWKCRPDLAVGGEASIWLDGSMTPQPNFVSLCIEALGEDDIAFTPHPWRDCIYTELDASVGLAKYDAGALREQCEYYRTVLGHPKRWGLFASGAMMRRHTSAVMKMGEHWWWENITRSWQDQLSLPAVLRLAGDTISWNTRLPWAQWWHLAEHGL